MAGLIHELLNQRRVPLGPPCGGVRRPKPVVNNRPFTTKNRYFYV